jgi:Zn finger protein HypA/HybF involved in hydrogenase expression
MKPDAAPWHAIGVPPRDDELEVTECMPDSTQQTSGWGGCDQLHVSETADRYVVRTWCSKCGKDATVDVRRVVRCPVCRAGDWMAEGAGDAPRAWHAA